METKNITPGMHNRGRTHTDAIVLTAEHGSQSQLYSTHKTFHVPNPPNDHDIAKRKPADIDGCSGVYKGGVGALRAHCVHCVRPILALLDEIDWGSGTMKITMKTIKITLKSGPQITECHTKGHQMPPSIVYHDRPHLYLGKGHLRSSG
jgi:hypothetical protein